LVIRELWLFAKSAYLDTPIPTLFKERLFVYLSRFCEVRYCITRHCGFLLGLGRSAGDPDAQAMTVAQVVRLLQRPILASVVDCVKKNVAPTHLFLGSASYVAETSHEGARRTPSRLARYYYTEAQ
jgi:hypothetical protein